MVNTRKSVDEYWSETTDSYRDKNEVDIDLVSINMSENRDKKAPSRFTKFVQFFILSIGIVYTTIANAPIFLLLIFHYGWFKVNETSFNRRTYIFETLTYFQYLNIGKFVIIFEVFLAIIIMMLSFWSFVKKRDTRKNGIVCMCVYTIATLCLLGFFIYHWAQEEQKLLDLMYDGFNRLFVSHFKLGDRYFEDLKYFMDTRKCCGPNGTLDFVNNMDVANEPYMPSFCHNSTTNEYKVGCYDKFTNMNRNMFDEALGYIIVTSIGVTMATVLMYRIFMKSASILPKIDRQKNRDNIKRVFNNSYVGRKINNKLYHQ